jgi:MFS family permease
VIAPDRSTDAPPLPPDLRGDLRRITADGVAFSLMVGLGESYLPALTLAAGHGATAAALVASAPMALGAWLGLVTPQIVARLRSHRRFVVLCATLQALSLVPLGVAAALGQLPLWLLFLCAGVYWGTGLATGPAWNTWIGTVVPAALRAQYFARRTRWVQLSVLVGLLSGGLIVGREMESAPLTAAFALALTLAAAARLVSAWLLRTTGEPQPLPSGLRHVGLRELGRRLTKARDGRFLAYLVTHQFGVQLSGPFFAPFFLGHLDLSARTYAALLATSFLTKTVVAPWLGDLARRIGTGRLLVLGALGIAPTPALYFISHDLWWLFALQVYGGAVWAAHELAAMLLVFEAIRTEERTSLLAAFNVGNALAMVLGVAVGSLAFAAVGGGAAGYALLFAGSTLGRAASLPLLRGATRHEVEEVPEMLATRVLALRPSMGSVERPVLPSLQDQEREAAAVPGAAAGAEPRD